MLKKGYAMTMFTEDYKAAGAILVLWVSVGSSAVYGIFKFLGWL